MWALKTLTSLSLQEIFTEGVGKQWRDWPDKTLERHRTTAFYSATGRSVRRFSYLSKPSFWIADDLTSPDNWMSSSLCALRNGIASGAYVVCK